MAINRSTILTELNRIASTISVVLPDIKGVGSELRALTSSQICQALRISKSSLDIAVEEGMISSFSISDGVKTTTYYFHPKFIVAKRDDITVKKIIKKYVKK